MSFLTGRNLPQLLHDIQKQLCSAKPWGLILRNWNELAVIFLRTNTYNHKKFTWSKFSFSAFFEEISGEVISYRHRFLLKTGEGIGIANSMLVSGWNERNQASGSCLQEKLSGSTKAGFSREDRGYEVAMWVWQSLHEWVWWSSSLNKDLWPSIFILNLQGHTEGACLG